MLYAGCTKHTYRNIGIPYSVFFFWIDLKKGKYGILKFVLHQNIFWVSGFRNGDIEQVSKKKLLHW